MSDSRVALEYCGEFLSHIGALDEANGSFFSKIFLAVSCNADYPCLSAAIAEILCKTGVELPESSSFRRRALLAAMRREVDANPMDSVFVFERLLYLDAVQPSRSSHALFDSPLFFHLLVERYAAAFHGLDAELFKLESDDLCYTDEIYETCLLIRDTMNESGYGANLTKFLTAFELLFKQNEPKDCWDAFYARHHLNDAIFRRDMKRALWVIESVTLGPTKLELVLPAVPVEPFKKRISRTILEKKFRGTREEWQHFAQIYSIPGDPQHQRDVIDPERHQEDVGSNRATMLSVDEEATESIHSNMSEESSTEEIPVSIPRRATKTSIAIDQEDRRAVSRKRLRKEDDQVAATEQRGAKRSRWTEEEVTALMEGYQLYHSYSNVWVLIKSKFPNELQGRSNVDLKDKFRNLVKYGKIQQLPSVTTTETKGNCTGNDQD
ncbi:hypothetical protein CCR75_004765 [Bremia lactucae]|uniref:Myb-like domain-containing protein n=1 Tax=Bremia lactucae TaxID=4779 RepID=A0A976IDU5_BRELC|nr:hypothetical protein CCR75_004765 [Bremia lactucae]